MSEWDSIKVHTYVFQYITLFYTLIACFPSHRVQETDGSYFENFTSLGWKRENRRMSATRAAEARAEANPENERDPPAGEESIDRQDEKEKLYAEVLHTIANTVGAPAPGGQVNKSIFWDE